MQRFKRRGAAGQVRQRGGWPGLLWVVVLLALTSGCAPQRQALTPDDYIEIDNPVSDGSPENARIWVPRASLPSGSRRSEPAPKGPEGAHPDAFTPPPERGLRNRLVVVEEGRLGVAGELAQLLSARVQVRSAEPREELSPEQQLAYLASVASRPAGGPVLFVRAEGGGGARLKGELYDSRGPVLVRSFAVPLPPQAPEPAALRRALPELAAAVLKSLEWFPWYARVVLVRGERVYLDAGAQSGVKPALRLNVYRGGEVVKGIGFAPGEPVASLAVQELVGPDGSFAVTPEASKIQPGDFAELVR